MRTYKFINVIDIKKFLYTKLYINNFQRISKADIHDYLHTLGVSKVMSKAKLKKKVCKWENIFKVIESDLQKNITEYRNSQSMLISNEIINELLEHMKLGSKIDNQTEDIRLDIAVGEIFNLKEDQMTNVVLLQDGVVIINIEQDILMDGFIIPIDGQILSKEFANETVIVNENGNVTQYEYGINEHVNYRFDEDRLARFFLEKKSIYT